MPRLAVMFLKLFVVILALGAIACSLLVIRQQRIEIAHEMSVIHRRLGEHQRTLWRTRSEIAAACRPDRVRQLVAQQGGQWMAIPAPGSVVPVRPSQPQRLAEGAPDPWSVGHWTQSGG